MYRGVGAVYARPIIFAGTSSGAASVTQDAFSVHVALAFDVDVGHLVGELFAVPDVPLGEQVVLDPDDLSDGSDKSHLALQRKVGVGHQGFDEDVVNKAETDAEVDEFDV